MAKTLWADNTRYIGVGAMFVGGLGTLFFLFLPIFSSLKLAFSSFSSVYKYVRYFYLKYFFITLLFN